MNFSRGCRIQMAQSGVLLVRIDMSGIGAEADMRHRLLLTRD